LDAAPPTRGRTDRCHPLASRSALEATASVPRAPSRLARRSSSTPRSRSSRARRPSARPRPCSVLRACARPRAGLDAEPPTRGRTDRCHPLASRSAFRTTASVTRAPSRLARRSSSTPRSRRSSARRPPARPRPCSVLRACARPQAGLDAEPPTRGRTDRCHPLASRSALEATASVPRAPSRFARRSSSTPRSRISSARRPLARARAHAAYFVRALGLARAWTQNHRRADALTAATPLRPVQPWVQRHR
jgi:hypothetical protein